MKHAHTIREMFEGQRPQKKYVAVWNKRSTKMHKLPSHENCNVDQIPRKFKRKYRADEFKTDSRCNWCLICWPGSFPFQTMWADLVFQTKYGDLK